jgi:hypothetical protein
MFICKNLNIEAKRSKLMLNCVSSEAKRTCSIEENFFRSEANMFILKNLNIDSDFVFKKTKKNELSFFLKRRAKNERVR